MPYFPSSPDSVRFIAFTGIFVLLALAETIWPRRQLTVSKSRRWTANLGIIAIDWLAVRLLLPVVPVSLAGLAQTQGWGLFNLIHVPDGMELISSLLILDLIIYLQHRLFHRTPLLWRLHRMHHTDLDLDVSSGTRFHPVEIVLSLLIKMGAVLLFGIGPTAMLLFEILLNATSMFSHANLRIPAKIDRLLRLALVTPDMHRVHHSVHPRETDSNFGFCLPWWDRLLNTYQAKPRDGHELMGIGLKEYRELNRLGLWRLLAIPFTTR